MVRAALLISYYCINPNLELDDYITETVDSICRRYLMLTATKGNGTVEEIEGGFPRVRVIEVVLSEPLTDTQLQIIWPVVISELGYEAVYSEDQAEPTMPTKSWIHLLN